jgi:hypothetical protein
MMGGLWHVMTKTGLKRPNTGNDDDDGDDDVYFAGHNDRPVYADKSIHVYSTGYIDASAKPEKLAV